MADKTKEEVIEEIKLLQKRIAELEALSAEYRSAKKELREIQSRLIQIDKMQALGILASAMAHEIKNILSIILQAVNLLESRLPDAHKKSNLDTILMIKDNIARISLIVTEMSDFSKSSELHMSLEDINSLLNNALVIAQPKIKFKNINIVRELSKGLPKVLLDKGRIEEVFVNLLLNAIQAMPKGGTLFLRSYLTRIDEAKIAKAASGAGYFKVGEEAISVEIEDTGIGIPQEALGKLFEPFFTTKGPKEGTGLGLWVTKNILDLHKGLIEIKSKEKQGTKAIVTFKIAQK
ncbi:MAG: ATP-binding protein [Candidatus Omnitrophica bacterium]|nr:ATP-binding protein [Candidatus Omnitrophota bacterium]